jgi:hypothetical protein
MSWRSARHTSSYAFALLLLLLAGPLQAQVPVPRDTARVPRDTVRVEPQLPDTMAVDTLQLPRMPADTPVTAADERQFVRFPAMPIGPAAGPAAGEWVWDRAALLREAPTSLIDLLRRIPGVPVYRAGMFVQPEAAAGFGGTAGRVEVEIDGFIMDPLSGSTLDLSQLPLVHVRELRVERRLGLLRIRILTDESEAALPYTRIEAGVAEPAANLFRGIFLAPHVGVGPLGAAIERLDTDGTGREEPASLFSGWAKWAWTDGRHGAQFELLRSTLERRPNSPWPLERTRQDLVLRLRSGITTAITGEAYAARSTLEETAPAVAPDSAQQFDRSATQVGVRAVYSLPELRASAGFRYRDAALLPQTELHGGVDGRFGPLRAGGELTRADWPGAAATLHYGAHAEVGLPLGASVFGELTGGRRGAPPPLRPAVPVPGDPDTTALSAFRLAVDEPVSSVIGERSGWRAGVALQLGRRASGSLSYIALEQDRARPFGLPFDTAGGPSPVGEARGVEAYGRLVIIPRWLAIESWINDWQQNAGWAYMPARSWRTALELHALPLASGNLEILARVEGAQRGAALVYAPDRDGLEPGDAGITTVAAQTVFNAYLQIRVIDVRVFLRWEDLSAQQIEDLPGRFVRGQRIFYGVKWNLWN